MKIQEFAFNPLEENTYLIWDEHTRQTAIVDAGMRTKEEETVIKDFVQQNGLNIILSLQTHMHFDHTFGLSFVHQEYGITPKAHAQEEDIVLSTPHMLRHIGFLQTKALPEIDLSLSEDTTLLLGETAIKPIHTPGHTPGGMCFYIPSENILLSGDTLFRECVGRTDLPGGNAQALTDSIAHKLYSLPPRTTVYPGHGPETTIEWELSHNPYV